MAEVYFRILFNKVRTILISSGSPKQLWGEAVLAMVYTYNRTLASGIGMIPYERWHGHPPDVSNLRTFGSLVYVYVASKTNAQGRAGAKRQKLDAKAVQVVFVGYAANQKGWKILDCNQGAIIPPIHVTFDESCSAAACDLKRQEFRKLASRDAMDFEYYSRTATSEVDLLFYSQHPTEEKPFTNDIVLLEFCCWL
ncbi:Retrovirus-related Pol Polyprotein from transposon TNT 1-94 [Phytophthora megakarya]|uniref:Retrovirus-related Pol Polyprotein from transposon TNT 1-94 n=1 Tax=Phytophthora megakarya TaxID=4795 RepID=A0A225VK54_9STRA|nr:Retrovirus-related Pol Polyprotein from transposon TNT 1-94 [Phytophthora megakarya]